MPSEVIFKLGEMLKKESKRHKNVQAFADAINNVDSNGDDGAGKLEERGKSGGQQEADEKISYRKLGRFLNSEDSSNFKFSIADLRAFDRYFSRQDQSLCSVPIFYRKESMVDYLAENSEMTYAVATRYQVAARTETVSRWDLRALNLLFSRGVSKRSEVVDVFHHGSRYADIGKEDWNRAFTKNRSSIVSFGSPFACHATERLLATIFAVKAYSPPADEPGKELPLYFFWKGKANRQYVDRSGFLSNRRQSPRLYAKHSSRVDKLGEHERAIFVGDRCFASEEIGDSYGLYVAQRRDPYRIYAAIIGTYGPDTYAVAKCLVEDSIVGELPDYDGRYKGGQPVFIAVIKTHIYDLPNKKEPRETRNISPTAEVCHSGLWERDSQHRWQSSDAKPRRISTQSAK